MNRDELNAAKAQPEDANADTAEREKMRQAVPNPEAAMARSGEHPVAGAAGAVAGAAAGAAAGVFGGPVGMAAGAVAGGVLGSMVGGATGERIDRAAGVAESLEEDENRKRQEGAPASAAEKPGGAGATPNAGDDKPR